MTLWRSLLSLAVASVLFAICPATGWAQATEPVPVTVTLTTDKVYYRLGDPVVMTMTIRNVGTQPVTLKFNSSQRYDFFVRHIPTNQVVWQWSFDRFFLWVLGGETLQPGETRVVKEEWRQSKNGGGQVPTGTYRLDGIVTSFDPAAIPSNPTFIQIGLRLF
jgi:hypothetical protein